jgi:sugar phosphate isomerase/epimerase
MVSCASEAGYSHVGLRLIPATPNEPQYDIVGHTPLLRETMRRLESTGVQVLDIEILRLKPETVVRDFLPVLETAGRLGTSQVLVAGNDPDPSRFTDNFAQLCDLAATFRLTLNIEPMPWTDVRDLKQANTLLRQAGRSNGAILIDAIHFDRAGSTLGDIAALPQGSLRYLQLCDAPAQKPCNQEELLHQARSERLPPGEGGLRLAELLRAVPGDLPLSIEVPQQALARSVPAAESARFLRLATERLLAVVAA